MNRWEVAVKLEFDSKNAMLQAAIETFCTDQPLIPGAANIPDGRRIDLELTFPGADLPVRVRAVSRGLDPAGEGLRLELMEPQKLRQALMLMIELHFGTYAGRMVLDHLDLRLDAPDSGVHEVISSLVEEEAAEALAALPKADPEPEVDFSQASGTGPQSPPRLRRPPIAPPTGPSDGPKGPPRLRPPKAPSPAELAKHFASRLPKATPGAPPAPAGAHRATLAPSDSRSGPPTEAPSRAVSVPPSGGTTGRPTLAPPEARTRSGLPLPRGFKPPQPEDERTALPTPRGVTAPPTGHPRFAPPRPEHPRPPSMSSPVVGDRPAIDPLTAPPRLRLRPATARAADLVPDVSGVPTAVPTAAPTQVEREEGIATTQAGFQVPGFIADLDPPEDY